MEGERKPMLLYFTGKALKTQTYCSISDTSKSNSIRILEFGKSKLLTVQHGWFLWENIISKYVSNLVLWNPYNLNKIILPPLEHNGTAIGDCILSSPPSANHQTCSIYLFSSHRPSIFYYQLGDQQWIEVCFFNGLVRGFATQGTTPSVTCFDNPVYCNGCVYAGYHSTHYNDSLCAEYHSIVVVIEKHQLNGFTINCLFCLMRKHQPTSFQQLISHLIGSNNQLFRIEIFHVLGRVTAVVVYKFDCSQQVWETVQVFKLNESNMTWIRVESLKNHMLFLGKTSFSAVASIPGMENKIYFSRFYEHSLVFYSLETNNYHTFQHDQVVDIHNVKEHLKGTWIQPRWH
ncbi:unnamed protein product [Lathyrus sativus]|nr:unnamed protein product [Lathyrus sativus]